MEAYVSKKSYSKDELDGLLKLISDSLGQDCWEQLIDVDDGDGDEYFFDDEGKGQPDKYFSKRVDVIPFLGMIELQFKAAKNEYLSPDWIANCLKASRNAFNPLVSFTMYMGTSGPKMKNEFYFEAGPKFMEDERFAEYDRQPDPEKDDFGCMLRSSKKSHITSLFGSAFDLETKSVCNNIGFKVGSFDELYNMVVTHCDAVKDDDVDQFYILFDAFELDLVEGFDKACQSAFEAFMSIDFPEGNWKIGVSSNNSMAVGLGDYDRANSVLFDAPLRSLRGVIDEGEGKYHLSQIYENGEYRLEIEERKYGSHEDNMPAVFGELGIEFQPDSE